MTAWRDGRWFFEPMGALWRYVPPGEYDPAISIEDSQITLNLDSREVDLLVDALQEAHWIKPRIDERVREEDVRIIHRLLGIIEKQVKP